VQSNPPPDFFAQPVRNKKQTNISSTEEEENETKESQNGR
jgi:hypothetical protein